MAVVLAFVALTTAAWLAYGGHLPLGARDYRFTVPVDDASALYPGSDVQVAGVRVGKVSAIRLHGTEAIATVELASRYAPIHTGARVLPRVKSLLGEGYLELALGPASAPVLPDGGRIPADHLRTAQSLSDALQTFSKPTRSNLRRLFAGFSAALRGRGGDINASIARAAPAVQTLGTVTRTLDRHRGDLQTMISRTADVLTALADREGDLQGAVSAGADVLDVTARRHVDLARTVHALPPFLRALGRTSDSLAATSGVLHRALDALDPVVPRVAPALVATAGGAPGFQETFRRLGPVYDSARRGLPAVDATLRSVAPALSALHPTLREINPTLELLSASRQSLLALTGSVAQLTNGTIRSPGGIPVPSVAAFPAIWNETIAGWIKKLPTNRPNPYPKPGSALDIASGGLKAYDCRHTGNRLYLPPVGTGAPSCKVQGPWTFQGKTAYYPRLALSPP